MATPVRRGKSVSRSLFRTPQANPFRSRAAQTLAFGLLLLILCFLCVTLNLTSSIGRGASPHLLLQNASRRPQGHADHIAVPRMPSSALSGRAIPRMVGGFLPRSAVARGETSQTTASFTRNVQQAVSSQDLTHLSPSLKLVLNTTGTTDLSSAVDTPGVTIATVLGSRIVAPDADDAALFQRALLAESGEVPTAGSHPRVAFLFLTRGPLPLARLWSRFFANHTGKYSIVIHTAPAFRYKKGELPKEFSRKQIKSKAVKWGDISIVDAERRLIANAMLNPTNTRFVLVSESCIPLFNFTFIYNYLMSSPFSFLRMTAQKGTQGIGRWNHDFLPVVPRASWKKGSQWFALTRDAATLVVGDSVFYPEFRDHCLGKPRIKRPACYADEHYMQTMLSMLLPEDALESRSLTWTAWSPIPGLGQHPTLYMAGAVSKKLFEKFRGVPHCRRTLEERSFCYLFVRKFHKGSLGKLLNHTSYLGY